jgi:hypothetical protein
VKLLRKSRGYVMAADRYEEIRSVSKLVEFSENNCAVGHHTLFRGQPEDKPLLPKIGRGTCKPELLNQEQRLFAEFKTRSAAYLDATNRTDWDLLAVAQHNGMATRLLDWTDNPLVALWFAVREGPQAGDSVVWCFPFSEADIANQRDDSPFKGERTKVFQPRHITKTIAAQDGWFTVHKFMGDRFIPLENNRVYMDSLLKLRVPKGRVENLRSQLSFIGVNDSTMFPDLGGLCDFLNYVHLPDLLVRRFPRLKQSE